MGKKKKDNMIESWSMFGVHRIGITLVKYGDEDDEDDDVIYNPHITLFLNDGKEYEKPIDMKCITLIHNMPMDCPRCLTLNVLDMYSTMYQSSEFCTSVVIVDHEMNELEVFNLDDLEDHVSDEMEEYVEIPKKRVLH